MDFLILLTFILLNGVFAASEIAIVSSRRSRLQNIADEGSKGASVALKLHENPSIFLSTIQVGITSVGIFSGAFGESTIAKTIESWMILTPYIGDHAHVIALAITVFLITFISVVVGELVPKQLAMLAPEAFAAIVARPMLTLAKIAHPIVWLLSESSRLILRLIGAKERPDSPVTDEEIKVLMEQGAEAGVFHESEQNIVSNVLRLDEQLVSAICTPRRDIFFIDMDDPVEAIEKQFLQSEHSRVIVCKDGLSHVLGVIKVSEFFKKNSIKKISDKSDLLSLLQHPIFIPETVTTTQLLEKFRAAPLHIAIVIDEHGDAIGLITLTDILSSIVGEISESLSTDERDIRQRNDGSFLIDGDVQIERIKTLLKLDTVLPGEESQIFHTLGGLVMTCLGRVPKPTDRIDLEGWNFEVMDMEGLRVDKVLVYKKLE